ncbi:hypothetical protein JB92DRAFT_2825605 [Gautieria morchelliformis]|nr:hypothetical protein JB92DRAFT_2825605 [Gautieria morchelliformis]
MLFQWTLVDVDGLHASVAKRRLPRLFGTKTEEGKKEKSSRRHKFGNNIMRPPHDEHFGDNNLALNFSTVSIAWQGGCFYSEVPSEVPVDAVKPKSEYKPGTFTRHMLRGTNGIDKTVGVSHLMQSPGTDATSLSGQKAVWLWCTHGAHARLSTGEWTTTGHKPPILGHPGGAP